jgi:hypothetical protein
LKTSEYGYLKAVVILSVAYYYDRIIPSVKVKSI